jgi:hypothetical protein
MSQFDVAEKNIFFMFSQGFFSFGFFGLKTTNIRYVQSV